MADKYGNGKWIRVNELKCFKVFLEIKDAELERGKIAELFDYLAVELNKQRCNNLFLYKGSEVGAKISNFRRLHKGTAIIGQTNIARSMQNIYEECKDSNILDVIRIIKKEENSQQ